VGWMMEVLGRFLCLLLDGQGDELSQFGLNSQDFDAYLNRNPFT
jgi:hypothetical protein